eukprot:sb/3479689/
MATDSILSFSPCLYTLCCFRRPTFNGDKDVGEECEAEGSPIQGVNEADQGYGSLSAPIDDTSSVAEQAKWSDLASQYSTQLDEEAVLNDLEGHLASESVASSTGVSLSETPETVIAAGDRVAQLQELEPEQPPASLVVGSEPEQDEEEDVDTPIPGVIQQDVATPTPVVIVTEEEPEVVEPVEPERQVEPVVTEPEPAVIVEQVLEPEIPIGVVEPVAVEVEEPTAPPMIPEDDEVNRVAENVVTREVDVVARQDAVVTREDEVVAKEDDVVTREDEVVAKEDHASAVPMILLTNPTTPNTAASMPPPPQPAPLISESAVFSDGDDNYSGSTNNLSAFPATSTTSLDGGKKKKKFRFKKFKAKLTGKSKKEGKDLSKSTPALVNGGLPNEGDSGVNDSDQGYGMLESVIDNTSIVSEYSKWVVLASLYTRQLDEICKE